MAFYRTYNGIDVLSDQEDGILVSFNKDGLTELRYMWRALEEFTTNRAVSTEMVTLQQAQNIYQNVLESGDLIKCAKDGVNKAASSCVTTAYLQIGNAVKPVWAFSTDSSYTNCVFIDMYTGDVLTVD